VPIFWIPFTNTFDFDPHTKILDFWELPTNITCDIRPHPQFLTPLQQLLAPLQNFSLEIQVFVKINTLFCQKQLFRSEKMFVCLFLLPIAPYHTFLTPTIKTKPDYEYENIWLWPPLHTNILDFRMLFIWNIQIWSTSCVNPYRNWLFVVTPMSGIDLNVKAIVCII